MILALYRGLTMIGAPLISGYLAGRAARGKEDMARLDERRGVASRDRPPGRLVWLHAASVGEAMSLLPIIERIQALPGIHSLLTTGTVTSAALMEKRLPARAFHQYLPLDRLPWVRRFLDHWKPDLALWCESEFWPNLLVETARRTPLVLLNGRVSDRSFARWSRYPGLAQRLLGCFSLCLAQTSTDGERLAALGAGRVVSLGNLKYAAPPLPVEDDALATLVAQLGDRPRWLAAQTHEGEEAMAGRLHRILAQRFPGLITVIVPRHPGRGQGIAVVLAAQGFAVARRAGGETPAQDTDILLADTLGELGLFYRLAPIVLIGKSLEASGMQARGGQNPLEPARLGCSVLIGPHMDNFAEISRAMEQAGAAERVADQPALAAALARRLADPALVAATGVAARDFAATQAGVAERVMAALEPFLAGESAATRKGPA